MSCIIIRHSFHRHSFKLSCFCLSESLYTSQSKWLLVSVTSAGGMTLSFPKSVMAQSPQLTSQQEKGCFVKRRSCSSVPLRYPSWKKKAVPPFPTQRKVELVIGCKGKEVKNSSQVLPVTKVLFSILWDLSLDKSLVLASRIGANDIQGEAAKSLHVEACFVSAHLEVQDSQLKEFRLAFWGGQVDNSQGTEAFSLPNLCEVIPVHPARAQLPGTYSSTGES